MATHGNSGRDPQEMTIGEMFIATADFEYTRSSTEGQLRGTVHEGQTGAFQFTPGGADGYVHHMASTLHRIDQLTGPPEVGDPAAAVAEIRDLIAALKAAWMLGGAQQ